MSHYSKLTTATAVAALAVLTVVPATASAGPICTPGDPLYNPSMCELMQNSTAPTPTPAPSTSSGSGGGITGWIDSHIGTLIVIGLVIFGFVVWRSMAKEKEEAKATADAAGLARGRAIAQDADTEQAARSPEDLHRYATFGWAVPWQPGTAFGNLVDRDGGTRRVHAAWVEACELARLGHTDENGKFAPAASVVNVNGYSDGTGDLELSVNTADYTVGERELNRVLAHLTRTARVETASDFTRNAAKDWHITRLSMIPEQQKQQESEPEQPAAPDPTAAWEW